MLARERDKLERALGGIKDMGGVPDLIFVIDTNKEQLAIKEAQRLGIPVAAVVDTNCDPDGITFPVPANDDAGRAIALYCDLIAKAALDGISRGRAAAGVDIGAQEEVPSRPCSRRSPPMAPVTWVRMQAIPLPPRQSTGQRWRPRWSCYQAPVRAPRGRAGRPEEAHRRRPVAGASAATTLGIRKIEQIAAMTDEDIENVDAAFNSKASIKRRLGRPGEGAHDQSRLSHTSADAFDRPRRPPAPGSIRTSTRTRMSVTASMVKELREKTGAGMMDCKGP
jgi:small subunit ribosomal protein S2